jgi:hypothetical protein
MEEGSFTSLVGNICSTLNHLRIVLHVVTHQQSLRAQAGLTKERNIINNNTCMLYTNVFLTVSTVPAI